MKKIENLSAYELVEKKTLKDLKSEGYILKHKNFYALNHTSDIIPHSDKKVKSKKDI